jgi:hypothetical protein
MPGAGFEPACPFGQWILNPSRIPIPPPGQVRAHRRGSRLCNKSVPIRVSGVDARHDETVRTPEEVDLVLELARAGHSHNAIARLTGIPRTTIRNWLGGHVPTCRGIVIDTLPGAAYSYLLGLYLGDGFIAHGPRAASLQIFFDARYPGIIGEAVRAIRAVRPHNRVWVARRVPTQCVLVQAWSTHWPQLFPQHGPGPKHERLIKLVSWQRAVSLAHPRELIRGLIHSDGSRFLNRVGTRYAYPRYEFSNRSEDIKAILCEHLDLLGIAWRRRGPYAISVARREAVAALDAFVGPKR